MGVERPDQLGPGRIAATTVTSWPAATSARVARHPITPVPPATKIFISVSSFLGDW